MIGPKNFYVTVLPRVLPLLPVDIMCERDNLCLIIDLDGFTVENKFEARELGYYSWQGDRGSRHFDVKTAWRKLSDQDKRTAKYVMHTIVGLPYRPAEQERPVYHCRDVNRRIKELYKEFRTEFRTVVGFKGGTAEKSALIACKIPYKNLEDWGCPKYDRLPHPPDDVGCGYHKDPSYHHCPQLECEAFWKWTRQHVFCD